MDPTLDNRKPFFNNMLYMYKHGRFKRYMQKHKKSYTDCRAVLMSEAFSLNSIALRHTYTCGSTFTCCVIHPRLCLDRLISLRLPTPCICYSSPTLTV